MIKKNDDFENLTSEFSELREKLFFAHDNGYDSFESSSVMIERVVSMWVSLEKI
jgi:hypothetical protein